MGSLIPGGKTDGWQLYWLGNTPESASSADQMLIGLRYNAETEELDAFRTSRAMIEEGMEKVDVSLFIYRDSQADDMGEENYNIFFFDTPEGERSMVQVFTGVVEGETDLAKSLQVILRSYRVDGAELPGYAIMNDYMLMCDGTDGSVSLFDGFYTNTYNGDTFESDYIRIHGIKDNDLTVTIKNDQPIWPEKTSEYQAVDLNGTEYEQLDNEWKAVEPDAA